MAMKKVFLMIQESCVDGDMLFNVVPCADLETAKAEMKAEIETLLKDCPTYRNLDLDKIESGQNDDYYVERDETYFYLTYNCASYYEEIKIIEKEVVKTK